MEKSNMDQRSTSDELLYRGILPVAMSGRLVRCHAWSDGTVVPVLAGFDDPDPDDPDPDDPDPDDPDDDDVDDPDEDDPDKIKDPARKKAAKQAANYRVQRNQARTERNQARERVTALEAEVKDLKEKGGSDETLKARVTELEAELKERDGKISDLSSKLKGNAVEAQVAGAVKDLKISDDVDFVVYLLGRENLLETDEDGDEIEDLEKHLKRLIKSKKLSVTDDDDDDDDADDTTPASGRSSGRTTNGKKKSKAGLDAAALAKKYPALRR